MTTRRLVIWITFLAIFAMAARVLIVPDTWWHLSAGRWMVENGELMHSEPFSYTRQGIPWQYPGLWFEVLMYFLYQAFGPGGLNLLTALFVTATYAILWRMLPGGVLLRAFVLVLSATVSAVYWAARPYLVTFLLAAIFLWILNEYHQKRHDRTWVLPLLMILWTNSHGGFIVGFLLVGIYLFERVVKFIQRLMRNESRDEISRDVIRLSLIIVIMASAVAINPEGFDRWSLPFTTLGRNAERTLIAEWQSPNFHNLETQPFAIIFLLSAGILGLSGLKMTLIEFLLFAITGYMGFISGRNIPMFALAFPLVLIRHIIPINERVSKSLNLNLKIDENNRPPKLLGILNTALFVIIMLAVVLKLSLVYPAYANWTYLESTYPVKAAEYIAKNPPTRRLFNSYNWGGYLTWVVPDQPVFIDGRADVYKDEIINQWLAVVSAGHEWETILDDWNVETIIIEPSWPVRNLLLASDWRLTYEDEVAVVFER